MMSSFLKTQWVILALIAASTTALYYSTMARSIWLEDSAEFITGAHTLSVIHPSGYPTFLMLGKIASLIPLGDSIAIRINALTLVCAVAAVVLLYFALKKLFNQGIAAALALLFAVAPMVWTQATYAEVYSLNTLFLILLLLLYLRWREHPNTARLCTLLFVYGLSLTNHFLPLVALPLILFMSLRGVSRTRRTTRQSYQRTEARLRSNVPQRDVRIAVAREFLPRNDILFYAKLAGCFLLGLLPYLYLPIRAAAEPPINWFGGDVAKLLSYNIAYGWKISASTLHYLTGQFDLVVVSYGWVGILLAAGGLMWMLHQRHKLLVATFALIALYSIGLIVVLTNGREYTEFAGWFYQFLYIPLLIIILIPIGVVLQQLYQSKFRLFAYYTVLLALLILPATQLGERFIENDRSTYVFLENYTNTLLSSLPANSTLLVHHDHIMNDTLLFGLAYQRYVNNLRPDVAIQSLTPVFAPPADFPIAELAAYKNRATELAEQYLAANAPHTLASFPRGTQGAPTTVYAPDNLALPSAAENLYHRSLVAKYYYDLAGYMYTEGKFKSGQWFLIQAIEYDPEEFSDYYKRIVALRDAYLTD